MVAVQLNPELQQVVRLLKNVVQHGNESMNVSQFALSNSEDAAVSSVFNHSAGKSEKKESISSWY